MQISSYCYPPCATLGSVISSISSAEYVPDVCNVWMQSQDVKAADSFYGSLEGVLLELRTVTAVRARRTCASYISAHFVYRTIETLRRFSSPFPRRSIQTIMSVRAPAHTTGFPCPIPNVLPVIKHPMDLGTMLKHVKARKYKSKQEFSADLGLIWKNCLKYNSGPVRVLQPLFRRQRPIYPVPGSCTSRMRHALAAQSRASPGACIRPTGSHHYQRVPDPFRPSIL